MLFTSCCCPHLLQISGGYEHTLALKNDGSVTIAGSNNYGQLGTNCAYNSRHQCPGSFDSNTHIAAEALGNDNVMVGAGNRNSMVLKADGRVFTAGYASLRIVRCLFIAIRTFWHFRDL